MYQRILSMSTGKQTMDVCGSSNMSQASTASTLSLESKQRIRHAYNTGRGKQLDYFHDWFGDTSFCQHPDKHCHELQTDCECMLHEGSTANHCPDCHCCYCNNCTDCDCQSESLKDYITRIEKQNAMDTKQEIPEGLLHVLPEGQPTPNYVEQAKEIQSTITDAWKKSGRLPEIYYTITGRSALTEEEITRIRIPPEPYTTEDGQKGVAFEAPAGKIFIAYGQIQQVGSEIKPPSKRMEALLSTLRP